MVFVRSSQALNKISVCELFELGRPGVRLKRSWTVISFIFFEELTKTIISSDKKLSLSYCNLECVVIMHRYLLQVLIETTGSCLFLVANNIKVPDDINLINIDVY